MNVLSLFSGIGAFESALRNMEIPFNLVGFSEIDKYAIQVAQKNYPDTIQVGDVTKLNYLELLDVDMVIGGSPCQDLSIAKQNREGLRGARSGLFWKYVEALEVIHPKWFLLENVASMRNEDRDAITATLKKIYPETECIMINSALVSAQQRKRYYWTNWHVEQPQDKGILLKDILESGMPYNNKAHCLRAGYAPCFEHDLPRKKDEMVAEPVILQKGHGYNPGGIKKDKAPTLTSGGLWEQNNKLIEPNRIGGFVPMVAEPIVSEEKSQTIKAQYGKSSDANFLRQDSLHATGVFQPVRIGELEGNITITLRSRQQCGNTLGIVSCIDTCTNNISFRRIKKFCGIFLVCIIVFSENKRIKILIFINNRKGV